VKITSGIGDLLIDLLEDGPGQSTDCGLIDSDADESANGKVGRRPRMMRERRGELTPAF
jgi:hypothetical protein